MRLAQHRQSYIFTLCYLEYFAVSVRLTLYSGSAALKCWPLRFGILINVKIVPICIAFSLNPWFMGLNILLRRNGFSNFRINLNFYSTLWLIVHPLILPYLQLVPIQVVRYNSNSPHIHNIIFSLVSTVSSPRLFHTLKSRSLQSC